MCPMLMILNEYIHYMKIAKFLLILFFTLHLLSCKESGISTSQLINPIIGDISFETRFGYAPDEHTDNTLRIQTHLAYVEERLRSKDVSHLSEELQDNRNHLLNLLHAYWNAGIFPKNDDYPDQRKPCFIDKAGSICAVGYLVEQTAGRTVAEYINKRYQYDVLSDIHNPILDQWILKSGLTKEECATIQPMYRQEPIPKAHVVSSSIFSGVNASVCVLNTFQMAAGTSNGVLPVAGLVSGAGQIVLGISTFPEKYSMYRTGNRQNLSWFNMGLGAFSMYMSTWNLFYQRKKKRSITTTWDIQRIHLLDQNGVMALSMTKRF
jgi:hypothetical protein